MLADAKFRHIVETIQTQDHVDSQMKQGNIQGAGYLQKKNLEKQELLQYGGSR